MRITDDNNPREERKASMRTIKSIAALVAMVTVAGVCMGAANAVGPPPGVGPPQLPGPFAAFAGILQANRGGQPPSAVQDKTATSSSPTIRVTDGMGQYDASLHAMNFPAGVLPAGASSQATRLTQYDLGSDAVTIWMVDPTTGKVQGDAIHTTYTSQTTKIGPGQSGSHPGRAPGGDPLNPNVPSGLRTGTPKVNLAVAHRKTTARLANFGIDWFDSCLERFVSPYTAWYYIELIVGEYDVVCDEDTNMIMGVSIDQAWVDLHWHVVGQVASGGGVGTAESVVQVQQCQWWEPGQASGYWPFRTRAAGFFEWAGYWAYGGNGSNPPGYPKPCQDSALFTGTLP